MKKHYQDELSRYLPGIFEAENKKGTPLNALLTIFTDTFSSVENIIEDMDKFIDPYIAPISHGKSNENFLNWLASWVALNIDEKWSEKKKRFIIGSAVEIYKQRGTPSGLEYIIDQFFDINVKVKEWSWPLGMEIGLRSTLGIDSKLFDNPDLGICFEMVWENPSLYEGDPIIRKIRTVIDSEKPAHTKCYFNLKYPELEKLRIQAMVIGINSVLGLCYIK